MASEEVKGELPQPQILNYKTWVMRVSVHCEGCKKKVKKILSKIQGVHSVDIDIRQQRVIVIGNVEADTLIKKLLKSGKNAELWPQQPIQTEKKTPRKSRNREKQPEHQDLQNNKELGQVKVKQPSGEKRENNPPPVKIEALKQPPTKKSDDKIDDFDVKVGQKSKNNDGDSDAADKAVESNSNKGSAGDHQEKDQSKCEGVKMEGCSSTPRPVAEAENDGGENGENGIEKRKDTGQNGNPVHGTSGATRVTGENGKNDTRIRSSTSNNAGGTSSSSVDKPANMESGNHHNHNGGPPISLMPANESPPRHHYNYHHDYPPHGSHHYGPLPSPSYGLSYNTAYPSSSYTTSYYAPSPPSNSYLYSYPGPQAHSPPPPPPDHDSYPSQPLDSFEMFSDENPNGCLVM